MNATSTELQRRTHYTLHSVRTHTRIHSAMQAYAGSQAHV